MTLFALTWPIRAISFIQLRKSYMDTKLTLTQAYMAMFRFLEAYYRSKAEPDELAILLGDIQPLSHLLDRTIEEDTDDITPADPASW